MLKHFKNHGRCRGRHRVTEIYFSLSLRNSAALMIDRILECVTLPSFETAKPRPQRNTTRRPVKFQLVSTRIPIPGRGSKYFVIRSSPRQTASFFQGRQRRLPLSPAETTCHPALRTE